MIYGGQVEGLCCIKDWRVGHIDWLSFFLGGFMEKREIRSNMRKAYPDASDAQVEWETFIIQFDLSFVKKRSQDKQESYEKRRGRRRRS
jgi:hypothetical protein